MTETIYLAVEGNWQDHEGGGDEILSAHASHDGAVAAIRERLKLHNKPNARQHKDLRWHVSASPSHICLEIQAVELQL